MNLQENEFFFQESTIEFWMVYPVRGVCTIK